MEAARKRKTGNEERKTQRCFCSPRVGGGSFAFFSPLSSFFIHGFSCCHSRSFAVPNAVSCKARYHGRRACRHGMSRKARKKEGRCRSSCHAKIQKCGRKCKQDTKHPDKLLNGKRSTGREKGKAAFAHPERAAVALLFSLPGLRFSVHLMLASSRPIWARRSRSSNNKAATVAQRPKPRKMAMGAV